MQSFGFRSPSASESDTISAEASESTPALLFFRAQPIARQSLLRQPPTLLLGPAAIAAARLAAADRTGRLSSCRNPTFAWRVQNCRAFDTACALAIICIAGLPAGGLLGQRCLSTLAKVPRATGLCSSRCSYKQVGTGLACKGLMNEACPQVLHDKGKRRQMATLQPTPQACQPCSWPHRAAERFVDRSSFCRRQNIL